jgi:hypothetical protein
MPTEREVIQRLLRERPELHKILLRALDVGTLTFAESMDDDEEPVVVCNTKHGGIDGAKQVKCACGELVWMSPTMQGLIKQRKGSPARVICPACFQKEFQIP